MGWRLQKCAPSKNGCSTRCSKVVTHLSTNRARTCLTSQIGRDEVLPGWYGRIRKSPKWLQPGWPTGGSSFLGHFGARAHFQGWECSTGPKIPLDGAARHPIQSEKCPEKCETCSGHFSHFSGHFSHCSEHFSHFSALFTKKRPLDSTRRVERSHACTLLFALRKKDAHIPQGIPRGQFSCAQDFC